MSRIPLWFVTAAMLCSRSSAADPDFERDVAPILTTCLKCHSAQTAKGELDLATRKSAFDGGASGPAIVARKPADSPLWKRVAADDMPPKKPLDAKQKEILKSWIASGASWGRDLTVPTEPSVERWWSFQPIPPKSPAGKTIDDFIDDKLAAAGLKRSPEADRRELLRRLKFDLLGLPPTFEEVEAFVNDRAPNAYERRVDEYLASPHYGERWARHWLDAVRFAESNGFETNQPRTNAWPYRDWIIESLNADLPYDRFVFAQLAGDTRGADAATGFLVAGPWDQVKSPDPVLTAQQRADELHDIVGTVGSTFIGLTVGCSRCHAHKFDPISQADYYRLKAVFAGVHHGERDWRTPESEDRARRIDDARRRITTLESQLESLEPLADPAATTARRVPVNARRNVERFAPVTAKFVRFVAFATNQAEPCLDELEAWSAGPDSRNVALASAGAKARSAGDYPRSDKHRLEHLIDGRYGNSRSWIAGAVGRGRVEVAFAQTVAIDRVVWGRDREGQFADRLPTRYRIDVSLDGRDWTVVASSDDRLEPTKEAQPMPPGLTALERLTWRMASSRIAGLKSSLTELTRANRVYAGTFSTPEPTFRMHRGDPMAPREPIGPGSLESIEPKLVIPATATDAERRTILAHWIVDPKNPLTARVLVNRLWQGHFGVGLVDTPSDFGRNGGRPSHPELLDWLAREFLAGGGSQKRIHRSIVTSHTYRQSSRATELGRAKDAQSRLLWRFPPRRLEAEAVRDAILATAGTLDLRMGGPGFDLFEPNGNYVKVYRAKESFGSADFRRMVYWAKPRMQLDGTFGVFDCPDGGQIAPKRTSSTTPLQSLNLLNGPFLVQQAGFLAERVASDADPVRRMFRLTFQRDPTATERAAAERLVRDHGLASLARATLNANEFLHLD
jgi:Protein of unknown function (DUF1553)/Protein of unknown function (DUF1549)/Planctomycete cytochrome C